MRLIRRRSGAADFAFSRGRTLVTRGGFLACLWFLLTGASVGVALAGESAADWTRALYQREIQRHMAGAGVSQEEFLSAFTPRAQELWRAARNGPGPAMEGPILSAYFGWGVLPRQSVALEGVASERDDGSVARIAVDLRVKGLARRVIVEARTISGGWRIDDIAYGEGESFLGYQRKCAAQAC